jgi:hypothetical protein
MDQEEEEEKQPHGNLGYGAKMLEEMKRDEAKNAHIIVRKPK